MSRLRGQDGPGAIHERPRPPVGVCAGNSEFPGCGRRAVAGQLCARCAPVTHKAASAGDVAAARWAQSVALGPHPLVRAWADAVGLPRE